MSDHRAAAPIIARCAEELRRLGEAKPWMTAQGLARKLGGPDATALRAALIEHASQSDRAIRYSLYPSRRSLDILWGHVEVVGELGLQWDLVRNDSDTQSVELGPPETPTAFISHNHRDSIGAFALADQLDAAGISCWMFQTGIRDGEIIADAVQRAIGSARLFITYVTGNSLGSLWVQKEFVGRRQLNDVPAFVVVDGSDADLVQIFAAAVSETGFDRGAVQAYADQRAEALGLSNSASWSERCFGFVNAIDELRGSGGNIYAYPDGASAPIIGTLEALLSGLRSALLTQETGSRFPAQ